MYVASERIRREGASRQQLIDILTVVDNQYVGNCQQLACINFLERTH